MLQHKAKKCSGFSLIEMSIIVTAFAVLMSAMLGGKSIERDAQIFLTTQDKIITIEQAVAHYINFYGHLPCPASLIEPASSADFGKMTDCSNGVTAPPGTSHIDNGTGATDQYQLRAGMVPTRALGLNDDYAIDEWGNRLSYVMIRSLGTAAGFSSFAPTQTSDYFQILDEQGNVLVGNSPTDIPAYFIFSHGKDARGAYTKEGSLAFACGSVASGQADAANCNLTKQFTLSPVNDLITDPAFYYDVGTWRKLSKTSTAAATYTFNPVNSIFVTWDNTCVIAESGRLFCTGGNSYGRLGIGLTSAALSQSLTFRDNASAPANWLYIDGGYEHSCGIVQGGDAYCWGYNADGRLGLGYNSPEVLSPTLVTGGYKWKMISSSYITAGVTQDGRAFAWGNNCYRRTGTNLGDCSSTHTPREILSESGTLPGHTDWEFVSVAGTFGCGLRKISSTSSKLYCWGRDNPHSTSNSGQLGSNNPGGHDTFLRPTAVVTPFEDWYWVGTKSGHSCALRDKGPKGGKLYCWGEGDWGYLGHGSSGDRHVPTEVANDTGTYPGFDDWTYISVGMHNTCGIRSNGDAYCWGWDFRKNIANGLASNSNKLFPAKIAGGHKWVSIATFNDVYGATCGVTATGDLYCWHRNDTGAWGNGTNVPNDSVWGYPHTPVLNTAIPFKVKHTN